MYNILGWLISRVLVIYLIVYLFCISCMDLRTLEERIRVRHLNDAIPDFSDMIIFSKDPDGKKDLNWKPYKDYFELILSYIPNDLITRQLLGFIDCYTGQQQKAIDLFKSSTEMKGKFLFWSNYNLAVLYYKKGMWPLAAKYSLNAVQASPQITQLLMQHSVIYKQIFISPFFKYSLPYEIMDAKSRAYILLLSSLRNMHLYNAMVPIANIGLTTQNLPNKDALCFYEGLAFFKMGQYKSAFLFFKKSLTLEKDDPEVYYYIGNIYEKAGQGAQARDLFQASYALHQKNDPRFPYDAHLNLRFF